MKGKEEQAFWDYIKSILDTHVHRGWGCSQKAENNRWISTEFSMRALRLKECGWFDRRALDGFLQQIINSFVRKYIILCGPRVQWSYLAWRATKMTDVTAARIRKVIQFWSSLSRLRRLVCSLQLPTVDLFSIGTGYRSGRGDATQTQVSWLSSSSTHPTMLLPLLKAGLNGKHVKFSTLSLQENEEMKLLKCAKGNSNTALHDTIWGALYKKLRFET